MTTRKSVSFGSKGSMVETWIIEDLSDVSYGKDDQFCTDFNDNNNITKTINAIYRSPLGAISEDSLDLSPSTDSALDISPYTDSTSHHTEQLSDTVNQSHEKPKSKTENKVTFCDIPREIETEAASETEPRQSSPPSITYSEVIIVTDPPPGLWPIKRTVSLESRDNPFQPDGDLSKETEDLLARAIIIRDKFIIDDLDNANTSEPPNESAKSSPVKTNTNTEKGVVEESLTPTQANESQCAPEKPKQNGKLEDSSVSPESVKPEVNSDGSTNPEEKLKDKKKQQQKCCIIM